MTKSFRDSTTRKLHPTKYISAVADKLDRLANGEYGEFEEFDTGVASSLSEKFKKAYDNGQSINLFSPAELRVCDFDGNITGLEGGEIKEEIQNSIFDNETEAIIILSANVSCYYEIVGTETGSYGLNILSSKNGNETDFSNTNISITTNSTHQYHINWTALSQGGAGVTLKKDEDGDGEFEDNITIQPPVANFTYEPEMLVINQTITFDASKSTDHDGNITSYKWDFGDDSNATGEIVTHIYIFAGNYTVILTVTDDGAQNYIFKVITVSDLEENFFDTKAPTNPYPSISGVHNGTITLLQNLTVSEWTIPIPAQALAATLNTLKSLTNRGV